MQIDPVVLQSGNGGTVTMQALLARNIDTAGGSVSTWVNAVSKGAKVKLLIPGNAAEQAEHSGLLVLADSGIHTIRDLAGKKIAVNVLGAEADFIFRAFLKQNRLGIAQVELVVVPMENQEQVLRSRQVDAIAWTTSGGTQFERAVEKGGVTRVPGTSSLEARGGKGFLINCEGFREEYLKDPERVRKVYGAISSEKGGNPLLAKYYRGPRWSPENQFITDKDIKFWIDTFVADGVIKEGQKAPVKAGKG